MKTSSKFDDLVKWWARVAVSTFTGWICFQAVYGLHLFLGWFTGSDAFETTVSALVFGIPFAIAFIVCINRKVAA